MRVKNKNLFFFKIHEKKLHHERKLQQGRVTQNKN